MPEVCRRVSIITPVNPDSADHLQETYASVAGQRMPAGWTLEWLVHIDGGVAPQWLASAEDPRLSVSRHPHRLGPAISRNLLLARATGSFVKVLDGDDVVEPDALAADIAVVERHPDVCWVTSRARDLLPDGSFRPSGPEPAEGRLEIDAVYDHWIAHDHLSSVHPATLFARTEAVVELGGWMALPGSEDTALVLCLNASSVGYFSGQLGLTYRKWPKQQTAQDLHLDAGLRSARHRAIERRLATIRSERVTASG